MDTVLTVKINAELNQALCERAAREGRNKSFYVRQGLAQFLEDLDDIEAADAAYLAWAKDGFKTKTLEEVKLKYAQETVDA